MVKVFSNPKCTDLKACGKMMLKKDKEQFNIILQIIFMKGTSRTEKDMVMEYNFCRKIKKSIKVIFRMTKEMDKGHFKLME